MAGFFHLLWEQLESCSQAEENILTLCLALSSLAAGNRAGA